MKKRNIWLLFLITGVILISGCGRKKYHPEETEDTLVRFATFNVAMFRETEGKLIGDLSAADDDQVKKVAEIIQIIRPEVLALMEFDYDEKEKGLALFQKNYLAVSQNGEKPIHYKYRMAFPSNTGIPSGMDLNNDGKKGGPDDAYGYGEFPGQYAFALLSMYPFDEKEIRTYQKFLWKDMPGAVIPTNPEGEPYYSEEELNVFRLSSKNHVVVPLHIPGGIVHVIMAHPTPPVFDGPEDRNGMRNHDEIRLLADLISQEDTVEYLYDDKGRTGGFTGEHFVIMGDLNADPIDGDSYNRAIHQLLKHPSIKREASLGVHIPSSRGSLENAKNNPEQNNRGNPWHDTSVWGLRIDYILPSEDLKIEKSGVFWPPSEHSKYYLVEDTASSDHLLVWMDIGID